MNHKTNIRNSKGDGFITLTDMEFNIAQHNQAILNSNPQYKALVNSLGYQVDITTLTAITKRIVEQKFYTIPFAQYLPVRVGEGAWSSELLTYRSFNLASDFEDGNINTGGSQDRLASADAGVDSVTVPVINWANQINYTIPQLQQAARAGNWDLVTALEKARKTNWDLGIQRIAFLGSRSNTNVKGLLTQSDVTANTSIITKAIKEMTTSELNTLQQDLIAAYQENSDFTVYPTHFTIPLNDYNGLASQASEDFPVKSKLALLREGFAEITMNPDFKILPLAYANQAQNADVTGLDKNRYTLYRYDEDSVRMDIPVDYTTTIQNTINGFQYQNVGYGQYTGAKAYRPKEMMYFDWAA